METEDGRMILEAATKWKRNEVAHGQRKRQREDEIRPEKREQRTHNLAGFYSEEWDESQQEEDD